MGGLACVTGRFQPVHGQHLDLFEIAARDAEHLVVAVTNPDSCVRHREPTSAHRHLPEANPFTFFERVRMLHAALAERGLAQRTTIVPFDLTRSEIWPEYVPLSARQVVRVYSGWERDKARRLAAAGYPVTVIAGDPATKISATDIRVHLDEDPTHWSELVPPAVVPVLTEVLATRTAPAALARWEGCR